MCMNGSGLSLMRNTLLKGTKGNNHEDGYEYLLEKTEDNAKLAILKEKIKKHRV